VTPFNIDQGYTLTFDETRSVGLTLPANAAETIAGDADRFAALPDGSKQHSILNYAPSDMLGTLVRRQPFMGQLSSCPSMPDSHNAGDFGHRHRRQSE
jgi:formamidase